jgi:regulator of CtrA degradation
MRDGNIIEMTESHDEAGPQARITPRLIDALYTEAMLLADEARAYFDDEGRDDRQTLEPFARVGFACESLKVTTRIMHIVAWLLTQRAVETGEIKSADGRRPERRLGHANDSDPTVVDQLPESAKRLIGASVDLYSRVKRLDEGQLLDEPTQSPARALMGRLERDLIWNRNA